MKRTITTYLCDVCLAKIEADQTADDWTGRNYGLCGLCEDAGHVLQKISAGDGFVIRIIQDTSDGNVVIH